MKKKRLWLSVALLVVLLFAYLRQQNAAPESGLALLPQTQQSSAAPQEAAPESAVPSEAVEALPDEHGSFDAKDDVALFLHTYGRLPDNYLSKKEAEALGWSGGSVEKVAPGKCIGGSRFGNYEGLLPEADGRRYYECDIGTLGAASRGAKRLVYSDDGLIYYTDDHYESFELLYGGEP